MKQVYPWHTDSFYWTRLCMALTWMVYTGSDIIQRGEAYCAFGGATVIALLDATTLYARRKNKSVVPAPLLDRTEASRSQNRRLRKAMWGFGGAYLLTLWFARNLMTTGEDGGFSIWILFLILANTTGWCLLTWIQEVLQLNQKYRNSLSRIDTAPQIATMQLTSRLSPIAHPQPIRIQAGSTKP